MIFFLTDSGKFCLRYFHQDIQDKLSSSSTHVPRIWSVSKSFVNFSSSQQFYYSQSSPQYSPLCAELDWERVFRQPADIGRIRASFLYIRDSINLSFCEQLMRREQKFSCHHFHVFPRLRSNIEKKIISYIINELSLLLGWKFYDCEQAILYVQEKTVCALYFL